MEKMIVKLFQRDFSNPAVQRLRLGVERLTWSVMGGPAEAVITATVNRQEEGKLAALAVDALRCPVEVLNTAGEIVWWGYIQRVEAQANGFQLAFDLDDLANRVCVQYWQPEPQLEWNGVRTFTAWADDLQSQQLYGVKERIFTLGPLGEPEANQARDGLLLQHSQLRPHIAGKPGTATRIQMRFICRGWWDTLRWKIARFNDGYEGFVKPAQGSQNLGRSAAADARVAQSFKTGYGGWLCGEAVVNIRSVGTNTDPVNCELCADAGGVPGAVLASAAVPAALIANLRWWVKFIFNPRVAMTANTPYWLVFSRTGALNTTNYYQLSADSTNCYANGKLMTWNGSAWVDVTFGTSDVNFYTTGYTSRLARLGELTSADRGGQFLTGLRVGAAITGDTLLRREGILDCQTELLDLLSSGDASGTPLYARVEPDRRLVIDSQPVGDDWRFTLDSAGLLRVRSGRQAWCPDQPAGQRVRLQTGWLDAAPMIERVEWAPKRGLLITW